MTYILINETRFYTLKKNNRRKNNITDMSKIFLIGNSYIGLSTNKNDWLKVHKEYFNDFLIPLLKKEVREGDIVVHLGDVFSHRNSIPIELLDFTLNVVENISKITKIHILTGTTDVTKDNFNILRIFDYIPNVFVHQRKTIIDFEYIKLMLLPYSKNPSLDLDTESDILLCHSDLNKADEYDKMNIEDFSKFKFVYSGFISPIYKKDNFTFIGSNFQIDKKDNSRKGIFSIDSSGIEKFYENDISPVFKKVDIIEESDITILEELKKSKDYIDISISNSLLTSSRKVRRKLEVLLEVGNFSSIDYINDVVEEKIEKTEDLNISIDLEYEDYIREYIKLSPKEDIKEGILKEYDKIIKIYKENYERS